MINIDAYFTVISLWDAIYGGACGYPSAVFSAPDQPCFDALEKN